MLEPYDAALAAYAVVERVVDETERRYNKVWLEDKISTQVYFRQSAHLRRIRSEAESRIVDALNKRSRKEV